MAALASAGTQLALPVQLPDDAVFATYASGHNQEAVAALHKLLDAPTPPAPIYLWGSSGRGKTHLLHAMCAAASTLELQVAYLPLREFREAQHSSLLQGLDTYDLICVDDIDAVVDSKAWCVALFELYNRLTDNQHSRLLISASCSATALQCAVPDLRSRLQAATAFGLKPMDDTQRMNALQAHANARGLELEPEVAQFIVQRVSRDMHQLMQVLNQLDRASMAQQRRLTVPFVKKTLHI